jgi:hypothetical protein
LGIVFPIPRVPGPSLTAEYRIFGVPVSETFTGSAIIAGSPSPVPVMLKVDRQYNHSFLLGVRYAFNVAKPVPVGPAQPAPARARSSRRQPATPPTRPTRASK